VAQAPDLAWIDALPGFVTAQIDAFSQDYFDKQPPARQQKLLEKRDQNRNTFVVNMRPYLGSDAAIEAHFKDVAPIAGTDLWAHGSTRERLLEVKADVESRGSPMPRTGVGQALRGRHLHAAGKDPGAGMMTHALGFAVDWKAYAAPHVKDPRLHALFEAVTDEKPAMHLKLGAKALGWTARHDLIEQLGKGTADPERERLLMASIESEYARLKKASDDFKVSLPEASLAQLRAVEDARNVVTAAEGKVARVRKKRGRTPAELQAAVAALADARAAFESAKQTTKPQLKTIFDPWLKRIGSRIDAINAAARAKGVDLESEVTSEATLKDLRGKVKSLDVRERPHERVAKAALADVRRSRTCGGSRPGYGPPRRGPAISRTWARPPPPDLSSSVRSRRSWGASCRGRRSMCRPSRPSRLVGPAPATSRRGARPSPRSRGASRQPRRSLYRCGSRSPRWLPRSGRRLPISRPGSSTTRAWRGDSARRGSRHCRTRR
jgi:hypothetical protein